MVINQGDIWWADLPRPAGSGPGFRRPVLVIQGNSFNRSRLGTVVCIPLTSNLGWKDAPGCVELSEKETGLGGDSVANCTQIVALDKGLLTDHVGQLEDERVDVVITALRVVMDR